MNRSSGRSTAFRPIMPAGLQRASRRAFQGSFSFQDTQSVLLLALAGALFGLLLSLFGAMDFPDVAGSADVQTLSAADPGCEQAIDRDALQANWGRSVLSVGG